MRLSSNMEVCTNLNLYYIATHFALQLQEVAKTNDFDPRGIKIYSKKEQCCGIFGADAIVK